MSFSESELRDRYSEKTIDLQRKIKSLELLLEDYKKSHGSLAVLMDSVNASISAFKQGKLQYSHKPKSSKLIPCELCMMISDSHYGAVQNKSEIEGFNEFSPVICEQRSMKFISEVVSWVEAQRSIYTLESAHVIVLGDLISGDIHEELRVTNAFPVTQQVVGAANILASQVSALSTFFKNVSVHFIVEDNHARLTKKPQAKEAGINSFNYLVGHIANLKLKEHSNVSFNIYPQYEAVVNCGGMKYLISHGHNMTAGFAGIPWYGIERRVQKEAVKRLNEPDFRRFDKVLIGHFHQPMETTRFRIGGSVSGTDAYDHKWGRHALPSQTSWLVHPEHGDFATINWTL